MPQAHRLLLLRRVGKERGGFDDLLGCGGLCDDEAPRLVGTSSGSCFGQKRKRAPPSFNRRATAECSELSGLQSRLAKEKSNSSSRSIASTARCGGTTSVPNRSKADSRLRAVSGCSCSSTRRIACPLRTCRSTSPVPLRGVCHRPLPLPPRRFPAPRGACPSCQPKADCNGHSGCYRNTCLTSQMPMSEPELTVSTNETAIVAAARFRRPRERRRASAQASSYLARRLASHRVS